MYAAHNLWFGVVWALGKLTLTHMALLGYCKPIDINILKMCSVCQFRHYIIDIIVYMSLNILVITVCHELCVYKGQARANRPSLKKWNFETLIWLELISQIHRRCRPPQVQQNSSSPEHLGMSHPWEGQCNNHIGGISWNFQWPLPMRLKLPHSKMNWLCLCHISYNDK